MPYSGSPRGLQLSLAIKKVNISFSKTRPFSPPLPDNWPSCSRKRPLLCMKMLITYGNEGRVWLC